jgi:hypothetical protein
VGVVGKVVVVKRNFAIFVEHLSLVFYREGFVE